MTVIKGVLNSAQIEEAKKIMAQGEYRDGSSYVGPVAKNIKKNEELSLAKDQNQQLSRLIVGSLYNHPVFNRAAFPLKVAQPMFAHYTKGMSYGFHVDEPIMGPKMNPYRSDVSCTVFLSDLDDYDGGELVIQTAFGDTRVRLPAGDAVIYPSTSLHEVSEVTRGERLVAVTWIQSMIADPVQRELLFEYGQSVESLVTKNPEDEDVLKLTRYYSNLKRMWSEL